MISRIKRRSFKLLFYLLMFSLSFVFVYPFLYMITTSLKSNNDLYNFNVVWIPRSLHFQNYETAAQIIRYFNNCKNSILVTVLSTAGQLISCSMAGYGLARFRFPGRRLLFFIVILAMIIPAQTIIVPQYLQYVNMGWINTFSPLIVPSWLGYGFKGALYIFIFRQFFLGLPKELEEAATVDGCNFIRTFISIVLPNARSSYLVVLVLAIVWHWSNYFEPAMYISSTEMNMLAMGLQNVAYVITLPPEVMQGSYNIDASNALNNAVLMAGAFMVILPVIISFGFLQKQFIQGIEHTGLTGE